MLKLTSENIKINDKLSINVYSTESEEVIIGLNHFEFVDEILIKKQSLKDIIKVLKGLNNGKSSRKT